MCEEPRHSVVDKKYYNKFCKVLELPKMLPLCIEVNSKKENEKEVLRHSIPEKNG